MDKQIVVSSYHIKMNKLLIYVGMCMDPKNIEWKNARCKKVHTDWLHLYEGQEKAKLISGDRTVVAQEAGGGTGWERAEGDFLGWWKDFTSYIEWWLHGYIQLSELIELNPYGQCIVYKLYYNNRKKKNTLGTLHMF